MVAHSNCCTIFSHDLVGILIYIIQVQKKGIQFVYSWKALTLNNYGIPQGDINISYIMGVQNKCAQQRQKNQDCLGWIKLNRVT